MFSEADEAIPPLALRRFRAVRRPLLVHHVAQRLRISRRTVRHLAETGKLRGFKPGRKIWYFLPVDVDSALRAQSSRLDVIEDPRHWWRSGRDGKLPLFYRKKVRANGESDEISLGPCLVYLFRWIVVLIVVSILILRGGNSAALLRFVLKLWP